MDQLICRIPLSTEAMSGTMGTPFSLVSLLTLFVVCHVTHSQTTPDPVAHLTSVTNQLSSQVGNLQAQVSSLKNDLSHQRSQINSLISTANLGGRQLSSLTLLANRANNSLQSTNAYIRNHLDGITNRTTVLETPVVFSVHFKGDNTSNHTLHVRYGDVLLFDQITYQAGGQNYNTSSGRFTAPSHGTYAFFLTVQRITADTDVCIEATIKKNDRAYLSVASACPPGYASSSNMAVVYMHKGDYVYVQSSHSDQVFGFVHSTFSGIKLTPN